MRTQSASSLSTFLKCPHAYQLRYLDGVEATINDDIEYGQFIHKELEKGLPIDETNIDARPYQAALNDWLSINNDRIVERERHIKFSLGHYNFQGYIDFVTENGIAGEMKITKSPGYYTSHIGYQILIYNIALKQEAPWNLGAYFLFEIDKRINKSSGETTRSFKQLHVSENIVTDLGLSEGEGRLCQICDMVEICEKSAIFPPSFNSCATCLYKGACDHYQGY